jgi:hypothetical protein
MNFQYIDGECSLSYTHPDYRQDVRCRVCRAETYRVKYTIYRTILRYTQELEKFLPLTDDTPSSSRSPSSELTRTHLPVSSSRNEPRTLSADNDQISRLTQQLRRLLQLFDDILVEEYAPENKYMPRLPPNKISDDTLLSTTKDKDKGGHITCDFCACDIFQSFFECLRCVPEGDNAATAQGDGLVICPSCYVDGRTCRCEVMVPIQCRDFEALISCRNNAAKVLRKQVGGRPFQRKSERLETDYVQKWVPSNSDSFSLVTPSFHSRHLLTQGQLSIFTVACVLQKNRATSNVRNLNVIH